MSQISSPNQKSAASQYTIGSLLVSIQGDARVSVRRVHDERERRLSAGPVRSGGMVGRGRTPAGRLQG